MTPDQEEKLAICMNELATLKAEFAHMGSVERAMLARIRELEAEVESKDKTIQHLRKPKSVPTFKIVEAERPE